MKKTNTKLLGMFVVGGAALLVAGLLVFGGGQFFRTKMNYVIYFKEPLSGLSVGAAVTSRGVRIGSVTNIVVEFDAVDLATATPVYIEINPERFTVIGGETLPGDRLPDLIAKGLRAQLGLDSIVTGQKVINFVMRPDTKPVIVLDPGDEHPYEIPAIPSETYQLKAGLDTVVKNLADMDIKGIGEQARRVLDGAARLLENPEIAEIIHNTNLTVPEFRALARDLDSEVESVGASVNSVKGAADEAATTMVAARGTLERADGAISSAHRTFNSVNGLVQPGSQVHFELIAMMRELTAAARSVRSLANTLERDPESVLFGRSRSSR